MSVGLKALGWLNPSALPMNAAGALEPMDFVVPCDGASHVVEWTPSTGARPVNHIVDADRVLRLLGGDVPMCVRLAEFMNRGLLRGATFDGRAVVTCRWDARQLFSAPRDAERFTEMLDETANPEALVARGNATEPLKLIVREAALAWLRSLGFMVGEQIEIEVVVCSRLGKDRFGIIERIAAGQPPWSTPLVGCQLCVGGLGGVTRAVICVTDSWLDEVRSTGVMRDGRFFLGANSDGPVYSHISLTYDDFESQRLIVGWAILDNGKLPPQKVSGLVEVSTQSERITDRMYVGSLRMYSDEGPDGPVRPGGMFPNVRDAESWRMTTNFIETFVNMDYLHGYRGGVTKTPNGFDVDNHDVREMLRMIVRLGDNPCFYAIPTASIDSVPPSSP